MALEKDTAIADLQFTLHEVADSPRQDGVQFMIEKCLSPAQINSPVTRSFVKQTVHKNVGSKELFVEFAIENVRFEKIDPLQGEGTYVYPVFTIIFEVPTILAKGAKPQPSCFLVATIVSFGPGKFFIIGEGEVGGQFSMISPRWNEDATDMDGQILAKDQEKGILLFSAPHELEVCLKSNLPLDETHLYSLKGSFPFRTSLVSSRRGSSFYPFDTYQFAGGVKFPFARTYLKPSIVSDLDASEGLALRLPSQRPVTISSTETWDMNLLFWRRAKVWQFVGACMVLALASAMIHLNASLGSITRIIIHALAFAIFFWFTHPGVRGVPFFYPTRMILFNIIVYSLAIAELLR